MSRMHAWGKPLGPDVFPALSLRQPGAWAVVEGVVRKDGVRERKDIENRRWSTSFRGEFLIHAAKGMTRDEYDHGMEWIAMTLGMGIADRAGALPGRGLLERGGFVGVARLVDVIRPCAEPHGERSLFGPVPCPHRWHMPEQYGFRLADVRSVPFTPWKGCLGFFGVPLDIARPLLEAASKPFPSCVHGPRACEDCIAHDTMLAMSS